MCELGKKARERINVDDPNTPPRASQKLIAAAMLLRAMAAPSTPEARNLHREAQVLIEQAAVQQAESSISRIRQQGSAWDDGSAQGQEASVHAGVGAGQPTNQGRTPDRERILDTRVQAHDGDARNVINARRRGDAEARAAAATTLGGVTAMTTARIIPRRRNPWGPVCSAERSARRVSPSTSASPPQSTSTRGIRTHMYGSMITA
jgi:hypothetical protein